MIDPGRRATGEGMRVRRSLFAVLVVMLTVFVGQAGPAYAADPVGTEVAVQGDAGRATVVVTNRGSQPCQVLTTAMGTVTLNGVRQGGRDVAPVAFVASFDDDLGTQLATRWRTLAPGQSVDLALPMVPYAGGQGFRTVSWAPLVELGALYPIDAAVPVALDVYYAAPLAVTTGAPACPSGLGSGTLGGPGVNAGSGRWVVIAVFVGLAVVVLVVVAVLVLRRRRRAPAVAAAVILVAGLTVGVGPARPAAATIEPTSDIASAVAACIATMRAPGGDPGTSWRRWRTRPTT